MTVSFSFSSQTTLLFTSSCLFRLSQLFPEETFPRTELACIFTRGKEVTKQHCPRIPSVRGSTWPYVDVVQHILVSCSQHTFSPRAHAAQGPVTLNWPWLYYAFSLPLTLDVLLLMSLWQYLDKAVAHTSSKERHRGAVPQFLIYVKTNRLTLRTAELPISVRPFFPFALVSRRRERRDKYKEERWRGKRKKRKTKKFIQSWQYDRKEQVIRAGIGNCRGVDSRSDLDSLICL